MKNLFKFMLARLREPSTLAGLSAVGLLVGLPPGTIDMAAQVVVGVAGLAAVIMPDGAGSQ